MKTHIYAITTNAIGFLPCFCHEAILYSGVDGECRVMHLSTSGLEDVGFDTFMKDRTILYQECFEVEDFDPLKIVGTYDKNFNWFYNNCEDFVSEIINTYSNETRTIKSIQRTLWLIILFGIITLLKIAL